MSNDDDVEIAGELRGETEAAYRFYDGAREAWLPKSKCRWDPDAGEMTMPEWLATDRGFL
jgi:hypothetical protein